MTERAQRISRFLEASGWAGVPRRPLASDASFRRYERLEEAHRRAMLMDAPPPQEDVRPFIAISRLLHSLGLSAPQILAEDVEAGLLLLEDFGDKTYTRLIATGAAEEPLYALAVDVLIALHRNFVRAAAPSVPPYDDTRLLTEAALLVDWYLPAVAGVPTPPALREEYVALWRSLLPAARRVPDTLVLRDFHVDNLMLLDDRSDVAACGLLDFQDAVIGPLSYDLVSLLEDARRDVSGPLAEAMLRRYLAAFPTLDPQTFTASYAVLGAQRNCKIVGIFTRLCVRDGKPIYLQHIPRLWRLLAHDLRHPLLAPIAQWLDTHIPPSLRVVPTIRSAA
ncbi:MAG TPA: phosphotransferase [Stellaceae bacterium]|nr:phosphotransferase [Stellaceae bacterium]